MLSNFNKSKYKFNYPGKEGIPESYPIPKIEGLLFYIQRNLNQNTVVYVANKNPDGYLNEEYPMKVYWINYNEGGKVKKLNLIQNKLAFGYNCTKINNETFTFNMVSYNKLDFFIAKNRNGNHRVFTKPGNKLIDLHNIFVYAEEFGIFPQVKFIEFFGEETNSNFPAYHKLLI